MPQHIGHFLDRATLVDDPTGQRVTQGMRSPMADTHASECIAHYTSNGVYTDGFVMWREVTHEHCPVAGLGALVADVGL